MRYLHRRMPGRGDFGRRHLCNRSRQVHRLRHLRRRLPLGGDHSRIAYNTYAQRRPDLNDRAAAFHAPAAGLPFSHVPTRPRSDPPGGISRPDLHSGRRPADPLSVAHPLHTVHARPHPPPDPTLPATCSDPTFTRRHSTDLPQPLCLHTTARSAPCTAPRTQKKTGIPKDAGPPRMGIARHAVLRQPLFIYSFLAERTTALQAALLTATANLPWHSSAASTSRAATPSNSAFERRTASMSFAKIRSLRNIRP